MGQSLSKATPRKLLGPYVLRGSAFDSLSRVLGLPLEISVGSDPGLKSAGSTTSLDLTPGILGFGCKRFDIRLGPGLAVDGPLGESPSASCIIEIKSTLMTIFAISFKLPVGEAQN